MNRILKYAGVVALAAAVLVACDDNISDVAKDGHGKAAATIDLGLPGGTDVVDAFGNVTVARNLTLTTGNTYILHNLFRVQSGFTITIQPGVIIKGVKKNETANDIAVGALLIERGAQIDAQGTVSSPIVFTSNEATPAPGDWGGIAILGKADANIRGNRGTTQSGTDGVGIVEGLDNNTATGGRYGNGDLAAGSYNTDNSGTLRYVQIAYAGYVITAGNELNGLTLAGVGSGTTLDFVQVHKGADDGFEFFGGTVNGTHLVSTLNADDDFDTDQGFAGKLQFGVVVRHPNATYLADLPLNGGESNGDNDDNITGKAFTTTQFSNFTFIGPYQNDCGVSTLDVDYRGGTYFRDLSRKDLFNSVIVGFPYGLEISSESGNAASVQFNTAAALDAAKIDVRNTIIVKPNQTATGLPATAFVWDDAVATSTGSAALLALVKTATLANDTISATSCSDASITLAGVTKLPTTAWSAINGTKPDLRPRSGSPFLNKASFSLLTGFTTTTYIGAFAQNTVSGSDWLATWTIWN